MGFVPAKGKPKLTRRDQILEAMLDIVVERGLHDAPMSAVIERSGASAGIIYHYFRSKEDILQALYERVRTLKRSSLMQGYTLGMEPRDAAIMVFKNIYRFYREHRRELRFWEQYEATGMPVLAEKRLPLSAEAEEFQRVFRGKSEGGVLLDLAAEVLAEMTLGLVSRLARMEKKLSDATLQLVAEQMWRASSGEK